MIAIDFAATPFVFDGVVGDKMLLEGDKDVTIVGTELAFALLKIYYLDKGKELRYATEEEIKLFRRNKYGGDK